MLASLPQRDFFGASPLADPQGRHMTSVGRWCLVCATIRPVCATIHHTAVSGGAARASRRGRQAGGGPSRMARGCAGPRPPPPEGGGGTGGGGHAPAGSTGMPTERRVHLRGLQLRSAALRMGPDQLQGAEAPRGMAEVLGP